MPVASLNVDPAQVASTMQALDSRNRRRQERAEVRASYDSAFTGDDNKEHWANTDSLSADAAASEGVRKIIRERARYEAQENNSIAKGIILTLANDVIGTGPRLQITTPDREINQQIEQRFGEWMLEAGIAEKLRTMKIAKTVDGESFATFTTNRRLRFPVQVDISVEECDRYQSPYMTYNRPDYIDGLELDENGYPLHYHRLKYHPGSDYIGANPYDFERLSAAAVIHLFRADRPEQHRGVSELASALPLFAQWRRYKLACLAAAETAADLAAVIQSTGTAVEEPDDVDTFEAIPIRQRAMLTMPRGWGISQLRSEQPPNTLDMFERSIIQEMARSLNVPFNVAAGNSSGYNFASGKLDYQIYAKAIQVERSYWERNCLDRILAEWIGDARLIPGFMPDGLDLRRLPHQWFWDDARPDIDPTKSANAVNVRLANGTTTLPREYAKEGLDWEVEQVRAAESLGLTVDEYRSMLAMNLFGVAMASTPDMQDTEDEEVDDEQEA